MLVKVFQISNGQYYAYDALTNRIITIRKHMACDIPEEEEREIISNLLKHGYVSDTSFSRVHWQESFESYREKSLHDVPRLMLQITKRCNLNCDYCVYSGNYAHMTPHADEDMSEDMIQKSIDFFAARCKGSKEVSIDMYGGEALLCLDKLRFVVQYSKKVLTGHQLKFRITSNGVLLNKSVGQWLAENPEIQITVTMNGPFHDQHRVTPGGQGSLDIILKNLRALRQTYPAVWLNQIQFIANIVHAAQLLPLKKFYEQEIGKAPLSITHIRAQHGNQKIQEILSEETVSSAGQELRSSFCQKEDVFLDAYFHSGIRSIRTRHIFSNDTCGYVGSCFPLVDRIYIHSNGDLGICESACDKVTLGNIDYGIDENKLRNIYNGTAELFDKKCRFCWAQRLCTICLKDLFSEDGTLTKMVSESFCKLSKEYALSQLQMYSEIAGNMPERLVMYD